MQAERIRTDMIHMLQERCDVAGVVIYNFELTDLACKAFLIDGV